MSKVTDIILITGVDDYQNSPIFDNLIQVDSHSGGNKCFQCDVYMGAVNYLNDSELIECFNSVKWDIPECVSLMLKGEEEDQFTTYLTNNEK